MVLYISCYLIYTKKMYIFLILLLSYICQVKLDLRYGLHYKFKYLKLYHLHFKFYWFPETAHVNGWILVKQIKSDWQDMFDTTVLCGWWRRETWCWVWIFLSHSFNEQLHREMYVVVTASSWLHVTVLTSIWPHNVNFVWDWLKRDLTFTVCLTLLATHMH